MKKLIGQFLKRLMVAALFTLLSPVMLAAILLTWIESGRGVIFKQVRIGKAMKPFVMYKLRTMTPISLPGKDGLFPNKDAYVTSVGRILRILKVDEIPQLFNILKGDMNFFGPRPLRKKLHDYYLEHIEGFEARYRVSPGLLGLSQIVDPADENRQVGLMCDLYYVHHRSFKLHLLIVISTVLYLIHSMFKHLFAWMQEHWLRQVGGIGQAGTGEQQWKINEREWIIGPTSMRRPG